MAVSLSSRPIRNIISRLATNWITKYDQNWWARFVKIAHEEDINSGAWATKDPLKSHAWVNIAIHYIASNISRVPFRIYNGDEVIENHAAVKLFDDVNPYMVGSQLWEGTAAWMECKGEAFWVYDIFLDSEGPRNLRMPTQIAILDPETMEDRRDKDGKLTAWMYHKKGEQKPIPLMPDDVVHFKNWNKWNSYRGMAPLVAMDHELAMDNSSDLSNLNMLTHGSVPDGILSTEQPLNESQAEEYKARWLRNHQGVTRKNMISVLGQGVKYQAISMSPKDMEWLSMKQWNRQTILARLGVPGVLIGVTDERAPLSGSDTKYQRKIFWNLTLIPKLNLFQDIVRENFFNRFHIPYKGKFDLTAIPELQEDEAELTTRMLAEITAGTMTINEMREARGREPVEWGNSWWLPFSMVPAGMEPEPAAIQEAPEKSHTPIDTVFAKKKGYTRLFKQLFWKQVIKGWEKLERGYRKDLVAWFFAQRSRALEIITRQKAVNDDALGEIMDDHYWEAQSAELKTISRKWFYAAMEMSSEQIGQLFESLGVSIQPDWTIYNTNAVSLVDKRINKVTQITETVRGQIDEAVKASIKEGLTEVQAGERIRSVYNIAQNRTQTIARTEIGTVMSTARIESYKSFGYEEHEWSSSNDANVRDSHRIDGEVVRIGELFSNGLRWPNDENGPPEETINCRCLSLPVIS